MHAAARLRGHGWPDGRELSGGAVSGSPAADPSRGGWRSSERGCSGRAGCCSPRQRRCERYQRPAAAARCRDPGVCRSSRPPCLTCSRHRGPPNPPAAGRGRPPGAGCARLRPIRQSRHVGSLISQSRSASGLLGAPQKAQPATIPPPLQPPRGIATRTGPRSPSPVGSVHHPACLDKPRILRSPPSTSGDTTMGSHLREELAFQSTSMPQGKAYGSRAGSWRDGRLTGRPAASPPSSRCNAAGGGAGDHDRQQCRSTLRWASQARTARNAAGHEFLTADSVWMPGRLGPRAADGAACGSDGDGSTRQWGMLGEPEACRQKLNGQHTSIQCRRMARSLRTWKSVQPSSPLTCL